MRIALGIAVLLGASASIYWFSRFTELSGQANGALAAAVVLVPLGFSLVFTAVCLSGVAIVMALERLRRDLHARLNSVTSPVALFRFLTALKTASVTEQNAGPVQSDGRVEAVLGKKPSGPEAGGE